MVHLECVGEKEYKVSPILVYYKKNSISQFICEETSHLATKIEQYSLEGDYFQIGPTEFMQNFNCNKKLPFMPL